MGEEYYLPESREEMLEMKEKGKPPSSTFT